MPLPGMTGFTLGSALWWKEQNLGTRRTVPLDLALPCFCDFELVTYFFYFSS